MNQDNPMSEIIKNPLKFIERLHQTSTTNTSLSHLTISNSFKEIFSNQESIYQIPSITNRSTHPSLLPKSTLVRFRCMIQDTGIGKEIYSNQNLFSIYQESDSEEFHQTSLNLNQSQSELKERELIYSVEIPGESDWLKLKLDGPMEKGIEFNSINPTSLDFNPIEDQSKLSSTRDKFPLKASSHLGVLLKVYDDEQKFETDSIKTHSDLEVIGILDWIEFNLNEEEEILSKHKSENIQIKKDLIPCIHVIFHHPIPNVWLSEPLKLKPMEECKKIRSRLIKYIAYKAFNNDELAAEYLLCSIISNAPRDTKLSLPDETLRLNLIYKTSSPSPDSLIDLLSRLLTRTVTIPFDIPSLNSNRFFPISNEDQIHSGSFQLTSSTQVILNSMKMNEGTLNSLGIKNLQCLKSLIEDQTLPYQFPFNQFFLKLPLGFIILSFQTKTFLDGFWNLPILNEKDQVQIVEEPDEKELQIWREYIQTSIQNLKFIKISNELSSKIQESFVEIRKGSKDLIEANQRLSLNEFSNRLNLLKLIGTQFNLHELNWSNWEDVCKLEKVRKMRTSTH
ncbi:mini-chromosome maintenance replisome factor-domain-containing protein [Melampsora americana]|nr:mini-chromosome maintenance replisome factor-domain-containing protein [Melampsora americana]